MFLPNSGSDFCILWACEVTKVLQMFRIPRGQFLSLRNRSQYRKIMFTLLSCWNTTIYLLSSLKSNLKSKSLISISKYQSLQDKTYQQAQQFKNPISKAICNTYHNIIISISLVFISNHDKKGPFPRQCVSKRCQRQEIFLYHNSLEQFQHFKNSPKIDFH